MWAPLVVMVLLLQMEPGCSQLFRPQVCSGHWGSVRPAVSVWAARGEGERDRKERESSRDFVMKQYKNPKR